MIKRRTGLEDKSRHAFPLLHYHYHSSQSEDYAESRREASERRNEPFHSRGVHRPTPPVYEPGCSVFYLDRTGRQAERMWEEGEKQ